MVFREVFPMVLMLDPMRQDKGFQTVIPYSPNINTNHLTHSIPHRIKTFIGMKASKIRDRQDSNM